jgi:hypothetical protein
MPKITSDKFVKFKNELLKSKLINDIKNVVNEKLKEIELGQFRTSPELVLMVANIIWNCCEDLKMKEEDLDKKQLLLDVLQPLLNLTPHELDATKSHLDYIINHNQIVIIKNSTKVFKCVWNFVKKKVL